VADKREKIKNIEYNSILIIYVLKRYYISEAAIKIAWKRFMGKDKQKKFPHGRRSTAQNFRNKPICGEKRGSGF